MSTAHRAPGGPLPVNPTRSAPSRGLTEPHDPQFRCECVVIQGSGESLTTGQPGPPWRAWQTVTR